MSRKVRSIRGEIVDFDLFAIKAQILNTPKNDEVKKRERFIDKKRRRGTRHTVNDVVSQQNQNEAVVREALEKQKTVKVTETADTASTIDDDTTVKANVASDSVPVTQKIIKKQG